MKKRLKTIVDHSCHPRTVRHSATVAVVVGTLLNLINHYDVLLGTGLTGKALAQMALTYLVPYVVSTHGQFMGLSGRDTE